MALITLSLAAAGDSALMARAQTPAATPNPATQLESRRNQVRQFIQQQQVSLNRQLECISNVRSLDELDRCQRGLAPMAPLWHHRWGMGGWGCSSW